MPDYYALIPAAGTGSRMGGEIPKQYQELSGKPLLHHTVRALSAHSKVRQVFVVLAPQDEWFRRYDWSAFDGKLEPLYCGGTSRAASVLNGLVALLEVVEPDDWILVHDAARPCLTSALIDRLIDEIADDNVGGLLALPVADTLKRADASQRVAETTPREHLWQAQTPQMFRYRLLVEALRGADPAQVTDESSAVERLGLKPRLVTGSPANLKVTLPEDLMVAQRHFFTLNFTRI